MEMEAVAETKKASGISLSGFEMDLLVTILNARTGTGTIKDLRLLGGLVDKLRKATPARPPRPEIRPLKEGEKEYPKEEIEAYSKQNDEWVKLFQGFLNDDKPVELSDTDCILVKQKLQGFNSFNNDEPTREKVLKLAEKFGL